MEGTSDEAILASEVTGIAFIPTILAGGFGGRQLFLLIALTPHPHDIRRRRCYQRLSNRGQKAWVKITTPRVRASIPVKRQRLHKLNRIPPVFWYPGGQAHIPPSAAAGHSSSAEHRMLRQVLVPLSIGAWDNFIWVTVYSRGTGASYLYN
ncbi:hypothetical protein B0T13DRAFT_46892 [Neurospora crassa]|nr:hypothetical protein B0T13DRAFT_46892 [Neurospora crassa]